jgi:hypothetical protein
VEASLYSLDGLERLRETVQVLTSGNLPIMVVPNMFDMRTRLARQLVEHLSQEQDIQLSRAQLRNTIRIREAACAGQPICEYAPRAPVIHDYMRLAADIRLHFNKALLQRSASQSAAAEVTDTTVTDDQSAIRRIELEYHQVADRRIQIAGDFNDWVPDKNVETVELADGMKKILHMPSGAYEYRIIVDGKWQQDPTNPIEIPNEHGGNNSLLRV